MGKIEKQSDRTKELSATDLIPLKYQHIAAVVFIYLSLIIFFNSIVFENKTYQSADMTAAHSWDTFRNDSKEENVLPLWNPYIFCGMPGFASLTYPIPRVYDLTSEIWGSIVHPILGFFFLKEGRSGGWLVYYLIFGIGVYLFAYHKLKNKPVAILIALSAMFSTRVAILIMIGHVTKIAVLAWFPFVFLLVEKLKEKFNVLQALLLIVLVRLMIQPGHVQFIFYLYLTIATYLLFNLIRSLIKKENWKGIVISGGSIVLATIIAFLMGADLHLSTLEYNPFSIRGSNPIIQETATSQAKTVAGGLDYDYATNWSFSPGEMMTFLIPSWYGFGDMPYKGPLTGNQQQKLNFYWGNQPSVDSPQYMGILVFVLAIIGFIKNRKDPFVQFMGGIIIFSLLVAFGKEFSLIYDLMFRYFPMFNKFRIPLMILMLVQLLVPILAGYGVVSILNERSKTLSPHQEKKWKYILGGLGVGVLISIIGSSLVKAVYSSFFPLQEVGQRLASSYGQLNPAVVSMIFDFVFSSVMTDLLIAFILLLLVFGGFYYYLKNKIKYSTLMGLLIAAAIFDLWRIAWKPFEPQSKQEEIRMMATPEFAKVLQIDTTVFRALRLINGQPVYDNSLAYWRIQNAYGYHGAKLRIYQNMVDVAGLGNPLVWQLMNIKYIISNREESSPALSLIYSGQDAKIYAFRYAMPRLFFVNKYEYAENLKTLNNIAQMSFNPAEVAYLSVEKNINIEPPLQNASAKITRYGSQNIEIEATATGNNLLFISEAYYPAGWKAYIDGNETEILQLNYLFRGIVVPKGKHKIEMKFEPASYTNGKTISLASNILIFMGIALAGTYQILTIRKSKNIK